MIDYIISSWSAWSWLILGFVLLSIEIVSGTYFFFWIGLGAIAAGIVTVLFGFSVTWQFLFWALFSLVFGFAWRSWVGVNKRYKNPDDTAKLNQRTENLIGKKAVVANAFVAGRGKVTVLDTVWSATGHDAKKGEVVTIVGGDGSLLHVAPEATDENKNKLLASRKKI